MPDRIQPADVLGIDPTGRYNEAIAATDRTFATYLDATERDQLDARAATAEQERDEALDELRDTRADRKHKTEVLLATARALDMLPGDRIDDTPAVASRLRAERDEARRDRDDYREARDVLRAQLDRLQPLIAAATTWRHNTGTYARSSDERVLLAAIDALPAGLGSLPPRAQEPGAWMNRRAVVSDALGSALTARGYDVPLPVRDRCAEAVLAAQGAHAAGLTSCNCAPPAHARGISRCVHSRRGRIERVAQAMRDANSPEAWVGQLGSAPFGHFAEAAVDALDETPEREG